MLEIAQEYIKSVFSPTDKVGVAVSGGKDSMCLLYFLVGMDYFEKGNILAVHVNHNLRESAVRDEEFVSQKCTELGVEFEAFSVDVEGESVATGCSIETTARNLRLDIFEELVTSGRVKRILTAHHALDRAESTMMHIARGCGLDGLIGMRDSDILSRPFLNIYPEEMERYRMINHIEFVQDETNFDPTPDRNFMRLEVFPQIMARYPAFVRSLNALAEESNEAVAMLDMIMRRDAVVIKNGEARIALFAGNTELKNRYIVRAIKAYQSYLGREINFERTHVERVGELFDSEVGTMADVNGGIKAARDNDCVALFLETPKCLDEVKLVKGTSVISKVKVTVTKQKNVKKIVKGVCDFDCLEGAVLRFRRDGDIFTPFGGGTKKLKEYFIDKKIPRRKRDNIPLVCKDNVVLAVIGMEISDSVKLTNKTKTAVVLEAEKIDDKKKSDKKKKDKNNKNRKKHD